MEGYMTTEEIMALVDTYARECEHAMDGLDNLDMLTYSRASLQSAIEGLVRNAERYRWLRRGDYPFSFAARVLNDTPFGIDNIIDAAMKGEQP
jgi:hypothetical protein